MRGTSSIGSIDSPLTSSITPSLFHSRLNFTETSELVRFYFSTFSFAPRFSCRRCASAVYLLSSYDTIRDAILMCARKPTRVSLIYRTEPTTKNCKTEKLKSKNGYARSNRKSLRNHVVSPEEEKERLRWEGLADLKVWNERESG